ncbi:MULTISPECIES: hypothetical protein [unclassified Aureispira]|uniref:hypothetical protein n=1 Tax=unclassified Aureispira TaxID=2649989 RepID=UPI000695B3DA|nr:MULTISPECIES: hypothetical protein [unclassified Aureispira]WMX16873.1 hypothetical protein QP953_10870 [Aureispira sp. CCB-E]
MDILDDYRSSEKEKLKGFVPYVNLSKDEIADVIALLEEGGVEFKLQKIMGSTNNTFIVPLASTELDRTSALIYIKEADKLTVDVILDAYYMGAGKRHLDASEAKAKESLQLNTEKEKRGKWLFINAAIFFLIMLVWILFKLYEMGVF